MLTLGGKRVLIGGFHDHWLRNGTDNPSLLMAAMNWYHYDFMCLMDGEDADTRRLAAQVERWMPGVRIYPGYERCFGFGHVVTVACTAGRLESDRTDYAAVLNTLKEQSGFVALAHPEFSVTNNLILRTGALGKLIDDDVMDAVEITSDPEVLAFVDERNRRGLRIPVVAGWDIHEVLGRDDLPGVLYDRQMSPIGHIDTAGHNRTIVICEDNTLPALRAAVRAGWSAVEHTATGRLIGPDQAVRFLKDNGWAEAIAKRDQRRDAVGLTLPDGHARVGRPLRLRFDRPGTVHVPGSLDQPTVLTLSKDGIVELPPIGPLLDRDTTHLPMVHIGSDGIQRAFAVRLDHAVGCDIAPVFTDQGPLIEVRHRLPFRGRVEVTVDGRSTGEKAMSTPTARLPLPTRPPGTAGMPYTITATDENGVIRASSGTLTYLSAPRFTGSWDGVPAAAIDRADLCGGYGSNRPYPGSEVFAGDWRFAWTDAALVMRARITDRTHFNPFQGHMMYQADSLQIGLDPMLRRSQDMGSAYVYNFCRGAAGPELFRWRSAVTEAGLNGNPLEGNVSLGGDLLSVTAWDKGLDYVVTLPWELLAPAKPHAGMSMGLFLHLFNNDGNGLLDAMQWPLSIKGMWTMPRRWGFLTLVDSVPTWLAGAHP